MSARRFAEARSEWMDGFAAEPAGELDSLLRGYTLVPPYQRASSSETVVSLFSFLPQGDPLFDVLDGALVDWIAGRIAESDEVRLETGINAYIQDVQEALTVAHRLPLPRTVALLHDRFTDLTCWAETLDLGSARDVRGDYWHTLSLVQTRRSFLSLWYRCCDKAGRGLPENYLFIGLLGLRHLPRRDGDSDLSRELLTGLARWARRLADTDIDHRRFLREWRGLALCYPRAPGTLRAAVAPVLEEHAGRPFASWWAEEVGIEEHERSAPPRELGKKEVETLLSRITKLPDPEMIKAVEAFADASERYADTCRDTYALTRNFNRLGNAVLERAPELALRLAGSAIERDSNDNFLWRLWSAALHELGRPDAAETVLWEATRRFPGNDVIRTSLAKLLADQGRAAEAEALFRRTMRLPPDDDVCRNALANFLAGQGRTREAEALYRDTMRRFRNDAVSRLDLGLLLVSQSRLEDAEALLEELRALKHSEAKTLEAHLTSVRRGQPRPGQDSSARTGRAKPARNLSVPPVDDPLAGLSASAGAMRAAFLLSPALDDRSLLLMTPERHRELRDEAHALLECMMRERPHHPVVRIIAHRYGKAEQPSLEPEILEASRRDYPLHLEAARHRPDADAFASLADRFPDRAPLTHLVHLVDEVPDAAQAAVPLLSWLKQDSKAITDPVLRYLQDQVLEALGRPGLARWTADDLMDTLSDRCAPETMNAIIDIALLGLVAREVPLEALALCA